MAEGPRYRVPFRRRREGRTDYRQRARLLRAGIPRAVVRQSLKYTSVQLIVYHPEGDRVLASANSRELLDKGWTGATANIPAAYLTGYMAGKRAVEKGLSEAVLDIGLRVPTPGSTSFAALKGLLEAGVDIPHGEEVIPSEDRLMGHHIDEGLEEEVEMIIDQIEGD